MAESSPLYHAGDEITRLASGAITGPALVVISGSGTVAASSAATASWLGVVYYDVASGDNCTVRRGDVARLVASGSITAGNTVEAAAAGAVAAHSNGTNDVYIVGVALNTVTNGQTVEVALAR